MSFSIDHDCGLLWRCGNLTEMDERAWWQCADGRVMEPLEALLLALFPYKNSTDSRGNCFTPQHYEIPLLMSLLPEKTNWFLTDDLVDIVNVLFRATIVVTIGSVIFKYAWDFFDPLFRQIHPLTRNGM